MIYNFPKPADIYSTREMDITNGLKVLFVRGNISFIEVSLGMDGSDAELK